MKVNNFKKILLGIGLGLVIISIVFWVLLSGDGIFAALREPTSNDSATNNGSTPERQIALSDKGNGARPQLTAERVIMLDGSASRQLSESEISALKGELVALDDEIVAITNLMVSEPPTTTEPPASTTTPPATTTTTTAAAITTTNEPSTTTTTATEPPTTTTTMTTTTTTTTPPTTTTTTTTTEPPTTTTTTTEPITTTTTTEPPTTTTTTTTTEPPTTTTTTTEPPTTTTTTTEPPTTTTTTTTTIPPTTATTTLAAMQPGEYVTLTIVRGDTATIVANKLLNLGLITDVGEFLARLKELQLTGEILDGTFELPYNLDLDTLIDRIRVHK